jgi:predicted acyltransferase
LFAGLIAINSKLRTQLFWFVFLLLAYWAAMMLIPVPGFGAGNLTVEGSLAGYLDRMLLPGTLYLGVHDPEGLVSTIPAIATALMGIFAGRLLQDETLLIPGARKALFLAVAGAACLIIGRVWGFTFPINKNLWTSSFTLFAGGWSLLLLSLFYLIIDVWGKKAWAFFFVVIGMNSITIYMAARFIDFRYTTNYFFEGLLSPLGQQAAQVIWWMAFIGIEWLFLYFLFRKKVFLRV